MAESKPRLDFFLSGMTRHKYEASPAPETQHTPHQNKMRAVIFKDIKKVAVEDRPVPTVQDAGDVIVKVKYTALCGR